MKKLAMELNDMIEFQETGGRKRSAYIAKEREINLTYPESQYMFRRLVERGGFGIFMADVKGCLFYVNHAFITMLGYASKDDILGANLADVIFRDPKQRTDFLAKLNGAGCVRDFEIGIPRPDGLEAIVSVSSNLMEGASGEVIGVDGIVHDVTEKNHLEGALLTEKQKLEQILEFGEAISLIREMGELTECVVQRTAKVLEAQKCSLMLMDDKSQALSIVGAKGLDGGAVKETRVALGEMIAGAVARDGQPLLVKNIEYDRRFRRANKPSYLGRSFMVVPVRQGPMVIGVINVADKILKGGLHKGSKLNYEEFFNEGDLRILCDIAREVSIALENVKLYMELNSLAVTDPLTHIFNYRQFSNSLEYEIKRCRRKDIPLCIIMIDLDDLKSYNDTFGHLEGDALLCSLGQIFKDQLREVDIVCRYAGDEFAIVLPETDTAGAWRAAQKIQDAVARASFKKPVTLSFGIAGYTSELTQRQLIFNADKALYLAKQEGKNRIHIF